MNTRIKIISFTIVHVLFAHITFSQFDCEYEQSLNADPISTTTSFESFLVENKINSTGTVVSPQIIEFSAGYNICLEPGFTVKQGASFLAEIEGCSNTCEDADPCPDFPCYKNYAETDLTADSLEFFQHEVILTFPDSIVINLPMVGSSACLDTSGNFIQNIIQIINPGIDTTCVNLDTLFKSVAIDSILPFMEGELDLCLCGENILKYKNPSLIFDETGPRQGNCNAGSAEGGGRFSLNYVHNPNLPEIVPFPFLQFPSNLLQPPMQRTALVAFLDTGVHQKFLKNLPNDIRSGQYVTNEATSLCGESGPYGWNFVNNTSDIKDDNGHGTAVTANYITALNKMNNPSSVYPHLLIVKVLDECGRGNTFDAICGIKYAQLQGADIMNLSWGLYFNDELLQRYVNWAANSGMHIICSAGNDSLDLSQQTHFPSGYANQYEHINIDGSTTIKPGNEKIYEVGGICKSLIEPCQPNPVNLPLWSNSNYNNTLFAEPALGAQHLININLNSIDSIRCNMNGTSFAAPVFTAGITHQLTNPNLYKPELILFSQQIHPDNAYYSYYLGNCN